jgi:hypothetical protein
MNDSIRPRTFAVQHGVVVVPKIKNREGAQRRNRRVFSERGNTIRCPACLDMGQCGIELINQDLAAAHLAGHDRLVQENEVGWRVRRREDVVLPVEPGVGASVDFLFG